MEHRKTSLADASVLSAWRKSSYSGGESGACLEVNDAACPAHVPVRDSKNPTGPALLIAATAWAPFVEAVKRDGFAAL